MLASGLCRCCRRMTRVESTMMGLAVSRTAPWERRTVPPAIARLKRFQHLLNAALDRTLSRRDPGFDEFVDREAAFLAELQGRQILVGVSLGVNYFFRSRCLSGECYPLKATGNSKRR